MKIFSEMLQLVKKNIRDYGMFIALFVIMITFYFKTDKIFMSPQNISNLINSTGYIAVLAVGMTLVIVIRHIDLSVGFLAGFLGAVSAIMLSKNSNIFVVIITVLCLGILVGCINAFLVAKLGVPSFVSSLAGMLIFRGALQKITQGTGTIIIKNAKFNAIGNGFIPDIKIFEKFHFITILISTIGIILFIINEINIRNSKIKYDFEVVSKPIFYLKLAFVSSIIMYFSAILAMHKGFSWTVIIVVFVVIVYQIFTTKTVIGRYIYAIGSNPEAAKLSGINVTKITFLVFASMSFLAALSGILFTSRLQSASTTAGTLFELDAIAAAYVGGVSAAGGVGKITGSIIGALVMASLVNGMNLMNIDNSYQYIIRGGILVCAVIFDVLTRNKASKLN